MADFKTTPLWLVRFNSVLLWLNPALSFVAVILALVVIAVAGEHSSGRAARAEPRARIAAAPSPDLCRPSKAPQEVRDLYLYD